MIRPRIELAIEELVLHGFAHTDRHDIAAAAEAELCRLLSDQGLPAPAGLGGAGVLTLGTLGIRIPGGSPARPARGRPQSIGVEIGRAVYQSLAGPPAAPPAAPEAKNRSTP